MKEAVVERDGGEGEKRLGDGGGDICNGGKGEG